MDEDEQTIFFWRTFRLFLRACSSDARIRPPGALRCADPRRHGRWRAQQRRAQHACTRPGTRSADH